MLLRWAVVRAVLSASPDHRRQAGKRLGPLGKVGHAHRDRLRSLAETGAGQLRAERSRRVADDGDVAAGLLEDPDRDGGSDGPRVFGVRDGDLALEGLRLHVQRHDLARSGREVDVAPNDTGIGLGGEVAVGGRRPR